MSGQSQSLNFSLPNEDWLVGDPPPGTIFFARRKKDHQLFVPNLVVCSGILAGQRTLVDAADSLFEQTDQVSKDAVVVKREQPAMQQLMQEISFQLHHDVVWYSVTQCQVLIEIPTVTGEGRGLLVFSLAACSEEIGNYLADFQAFIASAQIEAG